MNRRSFLRGLLVAPVGVSAALDQHGIRPFDDVLAEFGVTREEYDEWSEREAAEWQARERYVARWPGDVNFNERSVMRITGVISEE